MADFLVFSNGAIWFFVVMGLVAGRLAAVLAQAVQDDTGQIKVPIVPFFFACQKQWGWLPFMSICKKQNNSRFLRPFIMEIVMAILFVSLFYCIGWKYVLIEYLIFVFGIVTASAIDLERMILPDFLTLSGIVFGLIGALLNPEITRTFWSAVMGVLMGGGFLWMIAICYYALRKEDGIGGGDIKLLAWIGSVLTWKAVPIIILLACCLGLIAALISFMKFQKNWLSKGIPFGPYLSLSAILYIFFGEYLGHLYLSYFLSPILLSAI